MIFLDEQYIYHDGIMVLPDYSNPKQFYYLPPPPRLVEDPQTGRKVFKILKLVGGLSDPIADNGAMRTGVVFFDCDLRLTDEEQEELKDVVRSQLGIMEEINLAPLLYKEGEVTCYVLGEQDWDEDTVDENTRSNIFVEKLASFGTPSLYGDNRATFSASMTQEGTTALEASFAAGGVVGISIVYTLKLDALRPAFRFKVNAEWDRVYHYLENKFKFDLFFFSYEKTDIVEELEQEELITFEEVIIEEGAKSEVRELRKQLQEYILEKFFEPVLSVGEASHGRAAGMVRDIIRALVVVPSLGYKRVELTQEELKTLSFDVTQTSAIERIIYPQAHLTALIPAAQLSDYVQEVNTDQDLFYRQINVQCTVGGCDFDKHRIAWVHPFIRYGDSPEEGTDSTLEKQNDKMSFQTWLQDNHGFWYRTWYEVEFEVPDATDDESVYGDYDRFVSPEKKRSDRELAINPMEYFELRTIEFALMEGFPSDEYPTVEVQLKHEDADGHQFEDAFPLSGADTENSRFCKIRVKRGAEALTQYRLIYHRNDSMPLPKDWETASNSFVLVRDPLPPLFSVAVRVAELHTELGWADIVLRYEDPEAVGSYQEKRFFYTKEDLRDAGKMKKEWVIRADDPGKQRYQYSFSIFYQDGTMLESPGWIESEARTLTVGRRAKMYRTVTVKPNGPSFGDEELRDIRVTIVHREPDEDQPQSAELVFESAEQVKEFTYQVRNPVEFGYAYETRYRWRNGRVKRVQGASPTGRLDLNIPTKII